MDELRRCFRCKVYKPLIAGFCADISRAKGRMYICRNCKRIDYIRWHHSDAGNIYREKNREKIRKRAREQYKKHKDKKIARYTLSNSLKRGILKRLPCEICGEVKSDGHHTDYTKPLTVRWLCRKHHLELHRKFP